MSAPAEPTVETPSGKDEAYENFPVGSFLLPARLRPHIGAFYRFARAIDDIADNPGLSPGDKIARLDAFAAALADPERADPAYATARRMRRSLDETGVTTAHCLDLIAAFKQDAVKNRYADWNDLMGYCRLSAAPVGRYLVDLHGGSRDGYGPSDALCNALQVINHLQDCQEDYRLLDRVYLPTDWLSAEGVAVGELDAPAASPALRRVLDRCVDGTRDLLVEARRLPAGLVSRRLAMESGAIVAIAERLADRLAGEDPLAGRVALSKAGYLACCLRGALGALFG